MEFHTASTIGDRNAIGRRPGVHQSTRLTIQAHRHRPGGYLSHLVVILICHRELEGTGDAASDGYISRRDGQGIRIASRDGDEPCICDRTPYGRRLNRGHPRLVPRGCDGRGRAACRCRIRRRDDRGHGRRGDSENHCDAIGRGGTEAVIHIGSEVGGVPTHHYLIRIGCNCQGVDVPPEVNAGRVRDRAAGASDGDVGCLGRHPYRQLLRSKRRRGYAINCGDGIGRTQVAQAGGEGHRRAVLHRIVATIPQFSGYGRGVGEVGQERGVRVGDVEPCPMIGTNCQSVARGRRDSQGRRANNTVYLNRTRDCSSPRLVAMESYAANAIGDLNAGGREITIRRAGEVHSQRLGHHRPHYIAVLIGHRELEGLGNAALDVNVNRRDGQSVRIVSRDGDGHCICNYAPYGRCLNHRHPGLGPRGRCSRGRAA